MIPELGHFAALARAGVALVLGIRAAASARARGRARLDGAGAAGGAGAVRCWSRSPSPAWRASFVQQRLLGALRRRRTPTRRCRCTTASPRVWGGHEGSLLLWVLMLGVWTLAVARFSRHLPLPVLARILAVMGLVSVGFLLFMLLTSNPFDRLLPAAADGRDLNPLLQDPGMVIHPPMLYMGYVGFSVAFAFAIAALIGGNLDATWARWTRPWTTAAWIFLTIGIALGSWWAYYELGWGGWWFWDPVENASFMPWLVGTALIHSLAVTEKRGASSRGPCCWRSSRSRCRCSAPSWSARACCRRCTPSPPIRARGLFILAFLVDRDRRLAGAVRLARAAGRPGRALRAAVARDAAARQQRAAGGGDAARCCSARCTRWRSTRSAWARSRSARRTSTPCSCR